MPSKMNGKNKMYDFEKIAMLLALVITVTIVSLVVFATRGGGGGEKPARSSSDAADVSAGSAAVSGEQSAPAAKLPPEEKVKFTAVRVKNDEVAKGALILVNKDHKYEEKNLKAFEDAPVDMYEYNRENVSESKEGWYNYVELGQRLQKEALDAFNAMYKDFHASMPQTTVTVLRTYVDAKTQQDRYEKALETAQPGEKPYLQAGGCSELQTGLAVVMFRNLTDEELGWFCDNGRRYGFIARYPAGKESITYVKDAPTHFRYVGIPHASYIRLNKITLEEYLAKLEVNYRDCNTRILLDDGTSTYEAYACKAQPGGETEIMVPAEDSGWTYEISGTNDGYFIVTIHENK